MSPGRAARGPRAGLGDDWLIAAALATLAAAMALGGLSWRLDRLLYDTALALWQRPTPADVVIVAIDDDSVAAIGRWPWPRSVHATLLDRLAAAAPRAIAIDLVLSEPDADPRQDQLLAAAMYRAGRVVLPVPWSRLGPQSPQLLQPQEPLLSAAGLGLAESSVDDDGVLRHVFLRGGPPHAWLAHTALVLLEAGGERMHAAIVPEPAPPGVAAGVAWRREDRLLIRYAGPPGTVERLSYVDVLSGLVPASRLAGRYVLVGMTAQGLGDTLATPVNQRHQAMPGVEVLAQTLHMLRNGDMLQAASDRVVAALSALLAALLVLALGAAGQRRALALALGLAAASIVLALAGPAAGIWFTPVPFAVAALLAYPLWSWRRLEAAVSGLDDELQRLTDEPGGVQGATPAPLVGGLSAYHADPINDRLLRLQSAAGVLRDSRRFLADALAGMPTAMLVADAQGRVTLANAQAAALFEVDSAGDLEGLAADRLLCEFTTAPSVDWRALLTGQASAVIAVQAALPGHGDYLLHLAITGPATRHRSIISMADVALLKQAQSQREEALAFVSHDLRSPASSIMMLAELALAGQSPLAAQDLLHQVRNLAARTLQLSDDFVRAAQAELGTLDLATLPLGLLLDDALAALHPQAQAAGVLLRVGLHDTRLELRVDRRLVTRAVANLVSNALRFSAPGMVVEITTSGHLQLLVIMVRDQGPGLSVDQLRRLNQGDDGLSSTTASGVGLGLRFVQQVARRHGGQLRAGQAETGSGARFELSLRPDLPDPA